MLTMISRAINVLLNEVDLKKLRILLIKMAFSPNSIIININTKKDEPLNFDRINTPHNDSNITEPVILHLPKRYHCAFIIDGQHRLYGYAGSKYVQNNAVPVVAFENLPADEQIKLFVQINSKQKPVAKNLLMTIGAELMWNSEESDKAVRTHLCQNFCLTLVKKKIAHYMVASFSEIEQRLRRLALHSTR